MAVATDRINKLTKTWRKRIKSIAPLRVAKVFGALEIRMDEHYTVDLPMRYPANEFDAVLKDVRAQYQRALATAPAASSANSTQQGPPR